MVFDKVKAILCEQLDVEEDKVTMEADIQEDLGADSLDVVELIMSLEDIFGITISDEDAAQLYTVGRIVEYLEKLQ